MALPVTISGVLDQTFSADNRPNIYDGAVYVCLVDQTNVDLIEMWKATDPTSSFSNVGTNWEVTGGVSDAIVAIAQEAWGKFIDAVVQDDPAGNGTVEAGRFNMATDTWDNVNELIESATGGAVRASVDITHDQDGDIYICYQGDFHKDMGTDYESVFYSHSDDGGLSFGTVTEIDDEGAVDYLCPRVCAPPGNSNQAHFFYKDGADNLLQKAIDNAQNLRTERDTGFNTSADNYPLGTAIGFDRAGTSKARLIYINDSDDLHVLRFDAFSDDSTPTWSSDSVDTNKPDVNTSGRMSASLALDGSTVYAMWADDTDQDLYRANDADSDSWTARTSTTTGSFDMVSATIYGRDASLKLAWIRGLANARAYDELDLTPTAMALLSAGDMPEQKSTIGPFEV